MIDDAVNQLRRLDEELETLLTSFDTSYAWNYGSVKDGLRDLYEKAKREQWNGTTQLAWDTDVDPERGTPHTGHDSAQQPRRTARPPQPQPEPPRAGAKSHPPPRQKGDAAPRRLRHGAAGRPAPRDGGRRARGRQNGRGDRR